MLERSTNCSGSSCSMQSESRDFRPSSAAMQARQDCVPFLASQGHHKMYGMFHVKILLVALFPLTMWLQARLGLHM